MENYCTANFDDFADADQKMIVTAFLEHSKKMTSESTAHS